MAMPKSVTRLSKDGVTFVSNVDRCNYTIRELTRAAMRDVGKFLRNECTKKGERLPGLAGRSRMSGKVKKKSISPAFQYWVRRIECDLLIGTKSSTWYGVDQELGLNGQPKRGIIKTTVYENIGMIRDIEAKYLSAIEDEQRALALIDEEETFGDGDS